MMQLTHDNPTTNRAPWAAQRVQPLSDEHKAETLDFLSVRPLHTFVMTGWVNDNGLVSPLNRGGFYGYRNPQGSLEGVALIGHTTLFETKRSEERRVGNEWR